MRLRATVQKTTGNTTHWLGVPDGIGVKALPDPTSVEIVKQDGSVFLLRYNEEGDCIADTWHQTVDEAKAQAQFEFEIEEIDWTDMDTRH
jgi:hypothetical protein